MTQKAAVLKHLKSGYDITPIEALNNFGCFRLAAIIEVLRKENYIIETEIVHSNEKHFAKYHLVGMKGGLVSQDGAVAKPPTETRQPSDLFKFINNQGLETYTPLK